VSNKSTLLALVKAFDDAGTGSWTAVASSPSIDRDDEIVEAREFEPLPAKVPVRSAHFGGELVGSGRPYHRGSDLHIDGSFASTPRAQDVRTLVREGHLEHMSVVFLPKKDRSVEGRRHITRGELLAVDWVEIPSNRDARVLAVRGLQRRTSSMTAWRARIAALEAEVALLDATTRPQWRRPMAGPARLHDVVAEATAVLADLQRRSA
jgi:hypothetical protein